MRRPRAVAVGVALAIGVVLLAGCGRGDDADRPVVALDGTARMPDDEGVATSLTRESITLDGERTYPVSPRLVSFSTYTGKIEPMLTREGQYVQVGLQREGGRQAMVWMAGVAAVVRAKTPAVYYEGVFARRVSGSFVFQDGTVLRAATGSAVPPKGARVTVQIDPATHQSVVIQTDR